LYCLSVNHKKASAEIREKLAFDKPRQNEFIRESVSKGIVTECVLLCTCNRTEVYFCGDEKSGEIVTKLLCRFGSVSKETFLPYICFFEGDKAIDHLFRVACGIESMVMGEDEILGQTKKAYAAASDAGTVSYTLNMIFQAAIACAKKVKTDTPLSKTPVSIATLAANEAAKFGEHVNVLVIGGTGKIGSSAVKNLLSHKNVNVTCTLRNRNSDFVVSSFGDGIKTVPYSKRYEYMNDADCIISATTAPHCTVTESPLKAALTSDKPRLFIDLSVPADIDEAIENIRGVKLLTIDSFKKIASENNSIKAGSVESALEIIAHESDELKKELIFRDFLPAMDDAKRFISENPAALFYKMKSGLDAKKLEAVLTLMKDLGGES
jgi:glutamyl-tRNA reductase